MTTISDADMAWSLAMAADACLTGYDRTMTFVELGCGEHCLAIERMMNAVVSCRATVPVTILDRLIRWLDLYAGSPEEPRLRVLVNDIRARQNWPLRHAAVPVFHAGGADHLHIPALNPSLQP